MSKDSPKEVIKNTVPLKKGALASLLDSMREKSRTAVATEEAAQRQVVAGNPAPVTPNAAAAQAPAAAPATSVAPVGQPAQPAQPPVRAQESQTPANYLKEMEYAAEKYPVQMDILTMIRNALRAHIQSDRKKNPNPKGLADNLMDYFGYDEQNLKQILQAVFGGKNPDLVAKNKAIELAIKNDRTTMADFVYKQMFGLPTDTPVPRETIREYIDTTIGGNNLGELDDLLECENVGAINNLYRTISKKQKAGEVVSIDDQLDLAARVFQLGYKKHRVIVKNAKGENEESLIKFDEQTIEQMLDVHRESQTPSKS